MVGNLTKQNIHSGAMEYKIPKILHVRPFWGPDSRMPLGDDLGLKSGESKALDARVAANAGQKILHTSCGVLQKKANKKQKVQNPFRKEMVSGKIWDF